jgi:hypothetical protein
MGPFEQDWLEQVRRVACSLHYQHTSPPTPPGSQERAAVGDGVNDQGDAQQPTEQ